MKPKLQFKDHVDLALQIYRMKHQIRTLQSKLSNHLWGKSSAVRSLSAIDNKLDRLRSELDSIYCASLPSDIPNFSKLNLYYNESALNAISGEPKDEASSST